MPRGPSQSRGSEIAQPEHKRNKRKDQGHKGWPHESHQPREKNRTWVELLVEGAGAAEGSDGGNPDEASQLAKDIYCLWIYIHKQYISSLYLPSFGSFLFPGTILSTSHTSYYQIQSSQQSDELCSLAKETEAQKIAQVLTT